MQFWIGSTNKLATLSVALMATIGLPHIGAAQDARDVFSLFRGLAQTTLVQSAQQAWNRLPEEELACLNKVLASRGLSVRNLVQRGVQPGDPNLSSLRASCSGAPTLRQSGYVVDGLALGGAIQPDSTAYREYQCAPSEQFSGYTWCQKKTYERTSRGQFSSSHSILHSQSGAALYVNRFLEPAWFSGNEANDDINGRSKKYGAPTRVIPMPVQSSVSNGMIVTWGNVVLEQLDPSNVSQLAAGRDVRAGFMVDHIGNFQRSAQQGLPIYRLTGGAGYVWAASWDQRGVGTLRFLTVDASAINAQGSVAKAEPSTEPVSRETLPNGRMPNLVRDTNDGIIAPVVSTETRRSMDAPKAAVANESEQRNTTSRADQQDRPLAELDRAASPEEVLGVILQRAWSRSDVQGCRNDQRIGGQFRKTVECLNSNGFTFTVSYPRECVMTVTERHPLQENVHRKWDGTIEGTYLLGREVTFDLSSLREDRIKMDPGPQLRLELSRNKMPVIRVLTSGKPDEWTTLPSPPLESDYSDSSKFFDAYGLWSQKIANYGGSDARGFDARIMVFGYGSLRLVPDFLEIGTSQMGMVFNSNAEDVAATAKRRLIEALKSILTKCPTANETKSLKTEFESGLPDSGTNEKRAAEIVDQKARAQSFLYLMIAGGITSALILAFAISQFRKRQKRSLRDRSTIEPLSASALSEMDRAPVEALPLARASAIPLNTAIADDTQVAAPEPHQKSQENPSILLENTTKASLITGVRFANNLAKVVLAIGTVVGLAYATFSIGASNHTSTGNLKVWTEGVYLDPASTEPVLVLNIQNRNETPVVLTGVSVNDDPKCFPEYASNGLGPVNDATALNNFMNGMMQIMTSSQGINILRNGYSKELKLGAIEKLSLGVPSHGGCTPVKVVITTDRGSSTFNFE